MKVDNFWPNQNVVRIISADVEELERNVAKLLIQNHGLTTERDTLRARIAELEDAINHYGQIIRNEPMNSVGHFARFCEAHLALLQLVGFRPRVRASSEVASG